MIMPEWYWVGFIISGTVASIILLKGKSCIFEIVAGSLLISFVLNWGFFIIIIGNILVCGRFTRQDRAIINSLADEF